MSNRFLIFDFTLLKFGIVGVINTLAGSALIFTLYNAAGVGYWLSSSVSYILISILSFFLNKHFTFGVRQWSAFMVITFILTITFSYLVAYGASRPVMNLLLKNSALQIRENAALLMGMCLFTGLNYLGQRLIVFRKTEEKND